MFGAAEKPAKQTDQLSEPNKSDSSKSARYRIFSLKNISTKKAKEYLSELEIGTVSELPSPNTLLITASSHELIKAGAVLKLVDTTEPFVVKPIFLASQAAKLPSNEHIASAVGDISIGTFFEPPPGQNKSKAIIDVHNDAVLIVAPADKVDQIIAAIMKLQNAKEQGDTSLPNEPNKTAEPNQISEPNNKTPAESAASLPNDIGSEELFSKALNSLAQAEKQLAEIGTQTRGKAADISTSEKEIPATDESVTKEDAEQIEDWEEESAGDANQTQVTAAGSEDSNQSSSNFNQYVPAPTALADEELELNLPEKLNIIDLLDLVGKYLKLDIMYDPAVITGEVVLRVQGAIKVKNLYPYAESILKFKHFVMTRNGNLVTIVPAANVMDVDPTWLTDEGRVQYGDVIVTRPFNLRYVDATSAKTLLDGMKLGANSTPLPDGGTLIVTEFANRMGRIEELLALIDKPGEPKKFKFRQLKYTMASTMAPKIKSLMEQMGNISITVAAKEPGQAPGAPVRGRRITQPQPQPQPAQPGQQAQSNIPAVYLDFDERTNRILMIGLENELKIVESLVDTLDVVQQDLRTLRLYEIQNVGAEEVKIKLAEIGIISSAGETKRTTRDVSRPGQPPTQPQPGQPIPSTTAEALTEEPQVVIIEATNSLLVNATPEQHAQIAMIIGYVDSEQLQAAIDYRVYPLENQDPEKLAEVLTKLIQETAETKDEKGAKIQTVTAKKTEEDITIVPDPKTYSLIVYASKKNQVWISSLIKTLDEYRPQVLLDVTLVEITKNDAFNFDIDLVTKIPSLTPPGMMEYLSPLLPSSPFDPCGGIPSHRIIEGTSKKGKIGREGTGFYSDAHIQALFTMMDKKGYGRVLARPKLLVNDNEKGSIKTETKKYIAREQTNVIAGTGVGATSQSSSVNFESYTAGIQLDIQPHISKGDQLRLQVKLVRTDFGPTEDATISDIDATGKTITKSVPKPPDQISSNVDSVVTVPDNFTIILGGLENLKQNKSGSKVPLLGDIPLVGGLFKSTANSDEQSRLYIFVKAHILRPGEKIEGSDMERVSLKNRKAFEELEDKFQKLEDWPGIKPSPMDPNKILGED
jgi:type II secretory pathway component GspD/PulD (secretin)